MADRPTWDPYKRFNLRVAIAPILTVAAAFVGIKVALSDRAAGKRANADAAFMRRLRHAIQFPRPRRGRKTEPGIKDLLLHRLDTAGLCDSAAVDGLLAGSRIAAREILGLETLAQTDRLLSALKLARNAVDEEREGRGMRIRTADSANAN
jgi:hypothetical protein